MVTVSGKANLTSDTLFTKLWWQLCVESGVSVNQERTAANTTL